MNKKIRIATRKSPLALWQANFVKESLLAIHPGLEVEIIGMKTVADKLLSTPLNKIGGKGLFVKELEKALLENEADIAVHSIKDMPSELPDDLDLVVVLKREDPRDVFISNQYSSLERLPEGAILGTSSLRRQSQILALRPDLEVRPLRGNVGTRLQKLDEGEFDAIILAAAGIKRLNAETRIKCYFEPNEILPAAGQGALGIECRCDNSEIISLLEPLDDENTHMAILAERALTQQLGGSCQVPIAAFATCDQENALFLQALVGDPMGRKLIKAARNGDKCSAVEIGLDCAEDLRQQGAQELLG